MHFSGEGATLASVSAPSNDQIIAGYEALQGAGGAVVVERDVLSVTGPDAARYLQGQLSQDVVAMAGDSAWSFLLAPTGKVDSWLRVHRIDAENYVLETDPHLFALVTKGLKVPSSQLPLGPLSRAAMNSLSTHRSLIRAYLLSTLSQLRQ